MITIKKILIIYIFIATLYLSCFSPLKTSNIVKAEEYKYLQVERENAYIYKDASCKEKIFIIQKGYYVKVVEYSSSSVKIIYGENNDKYPAISGYVKKQDLSTITYNPVNVYEILYVKIINEGVIFKDTYKTKPIYNLIQNKYTYVYGEYVLENGSVLCYSYYDDELGYIKKENLDSYEFPIFKEESNEVTENTNSTLKPTNKTIEFSDSIQIIIIVGISVISVSVVYVLFKPTKTISEDKYNEE